MQFEIKYQTRTGRILSPTTWQELTIEVKSIRALKIKVRKILNLDINLMSTLIATELNTRLAIHLHDFGYGGKNNKRVLRWTEV